MEKKKVNKPLQAEFVGSCGKKHKVAVSVGLECVLKQLDTNEELQYRFILSINRKGAEIWELEK